VRFGSAVKPMAWDGTTFFPHRFESWTYPDLRVAITQNNGVVARLIPTGDNLGASFNSLMVSSFLHHLVGTTFDRVRGVDTLKTYYNAALATNTTGDVWTPASGLRFRLFGLVVSGDFGAGVQVEILDGATVIANFVYGAEPVMMAMPADGYLSSAANNVLRVRHQKGANAIVAVNAWGSEE